MEFRSLRNKKYFLLGFIITLLLGILGLSLQSFVDDIEAGNYNEGKLNPFFFGDLLRNFFIEEISGISLAVSFILFSLYLFSRIPKNKNLIIEVIKHPFTIFVASVGLFFMFLSLGTDSGGLALLFLPIFAFTSIYFGYSLFYESQNRIEKVLSILFIIVVHITMLPGLRVSLAGAVFGFAIALIPLGISIPLYILALKLAKKRRGRSKDD